MYHWEIILRHWKFCKTYDVIDLHFIPFQDDCRGCIMLVALRNKLNRKRSCNDLIYLKLVNRFQLEDVTSSQIEREICSVSDTNITPLHEHSSVTHPLCHNSKLVKKKKCAQEGLTQQKVNMMELDLCILLNLSMIARLCSWNCRPLTCIINGTWNIYLWCSSSCQMSA